MMEQSQMSQQMPGQMDMGGMQQMGQMPNMMNQQMGFGGQENQNLFMQMMLANAMSQQDMGGNP